MPHELYINSSAALFDVDIYAHSSFGSGIYIYIFGQPCMVRLLSLLVVAYIWFQLKHKSNVIRSIDSLMDKIASYVRRLG